MNRRKVFSLAFLSGALILGSTLSAFAQGGGYFSNWPKGSSPQEVGKKVAEHFVASPHQYTATIHYSEVATWYGALTFAQLTKDDALRKELIARFDPLFPDGADAKQRPPRRYTTAADPPPAHSPADAPAQAPRPPTWRARPWPRRVASSRGSPRTTPPLPARRWRTMARP